ncbi:DUF3363 domain-containing protein [Nisaea sp.]|uniref:DUF3363 domain-containing protein n=2 Tax=Alphaproteobacteria TaxID=28211 RepID=UPI003266FA10
MRGSSASWRSGTAPELMQRVVVKTRIVQTGAGTKGKARAHMNYITRDGAGEGGEQAVLFGNDETPKAGFVKTVEGDERHFRLIISPEFAPENMEELTRNVMADMEIDLDTQLEWKAVIHKNTDHPHAHVVLRGVSDTGETLTIPKDYLTRGIRERAQERVTRSIGYRTELDIVESLEKEIPATRITSLDHKLEAALTDERTFERSAPEALSFKEPELDRIARRAETLVGFGVAERDDSGAIYLPKEWKKEMTALSRFVAMHERSYQQFPGEQRELVDLNAGKGPAKTLVGEVKARGLDNELFDTPFVVIDGGDGRIYHKTMSSLKGAADLHEGAVVRISPGARGAFIERIGQGLSQSVGSSGPNWLDEYARGQQGASETPLQKRLSKAVADRKLFHERAGRPGLLGNDSEYQKWVLDGRSAIVPEAIREKYEDHSRELFFGGKTRRFEGSLDAVITTPNGKFGVVADHARNRYVTLPLRENQLSMKGQMVTLSAMSGQGQNRVIMQTLSRSL